MRITNILPDPQYFSYASTGPGGRKLKPGEATPPLPFKILCEPQLWKDLRSDKIRIRLDKGDLDFIQDIQNAQTQDIAVKQHPAPPPPPVKKPPMPPPSLKIHKSDKQREEHVAGRPVYAPITPVTVEQIRSGKVSLKDLQLQNRTTSIPVLRTGAPTTDDSKKASLDEIQQHLKSRV